MHQNMNKKYMAISIAALAGIILIMLICLNASVNGSLETDQSELLGLILRSGGDPAAVLTNPAAAEGSEELTEDTGWSDYQNLRNSSYFIATTHNGSVTGVSLYGCPDLNEAGAEALAEAVLRQGSAEGRAGAYAYRELVGPSGSTYAFLNVSKDDLLAIRLLMTSIGVGALGIGLVLIFVTVTATRVIRRAERHLAAGQLVMDKSAEEAGESARFLVESAKNRGIVNAREDLDEGERLRAVSAELYAVAGSFGKTGRREIVNVSALLKELLEEFEPELEEAGALIHVSIEEDVQLATRPGELRETLWLLLQNARENLADPGDVFVDALQSDGEAGIIIRFTARSVPQTEAGVLFTTPKTRDGGYFTAGLLGAKLIAEENGADLQCEYIEPSDVCFTIRVKKTFPGRGRA